MSLGLEVCNIHSIMSYFQFPSTYAINSRKAMEHRTPSSGRGSIPNLTPSLKSRPSFASVCVLVGPALVQLSGPQDHPLGQQLPPSVAAQLYHPVAQVPDAVVVAAPVNGTTIVTPELMSVV